MSELRVLHLLHHVRDSGNGIVNAAVDLACAQQDAGATVAVASAGGQLERLLVDEGIRHVELRFGRTPGALIGTLRRLRAIVAEFRPDVVHAHMVTAALVARAAIVGRHCALVTTVHNEFAAAAVLMRVGGRVIAVSDAAAASLELRGVPARKIRTVRNAPLGSLRVPPLAALVPVDLPRPTILSVSGLYRRKGIDLLIDAFAGIAGEVPRAHLVIVGEGPDRALFQQQAAASGFGDRIRFEGFQPAPQRYMLAADIMVLPSRREPFGLVLAEARACGTAIVASDVDGIPEALDGGRAGILFWPIDPIQLADALRRLLGDPAELAEWRRRASVGLDWLHVDRAARETLEVYRELVPAPPRAVTSRREPSNTPFEPMGSPTGSPPC